MRTIVHLAASPFFGGPERQMLGLAMHLPSDHRSIFFSFAERGLCQPFLDQLQKHNIPAEALHQNTPHILAAAKEVAHHLRDTRADVLCCHGYKADIVGWLAGRRAGVPVVSISRGWTAATRRVRFYEMLDRRVLRWMDRVVCVSEGQATKVRAAGVREDRIMVIRNAIDLDRFSSPDPTYRQKLRELLPSSPARIVCAAGRLSPEKGFPVLVAAAGILRQAAADVGFILFGEGPERPLIEEQIRTLGLDGRFVLAGFRDDVDAFLPHADAVVLPSHTEGLPNVALEALAAGVPVVATAVGGTPEVVQDGVSGYLVPSGDPAALARRIVDVLADENQRIAMGQCGRAYLRQSFGFESQAQQYIRLFNDIVQDQPQTSPKLGKTSPAGVS